MKYGTGKRFSIVLWVIILVFMAVVLTFPRWIMLFYPQPHRELVFSASYKYGVDPFLAFAVIRVESKYQPAAESPAGARGLMQIMPETGQWIAQQQGIKDFNTSDLHQPETNIEFGCWYLADLSQEFDYRLPLVIAAYNAGRGTVRDWVLSGQWDGNPEKLDNIPFKETRAYVKIVLKNYEAYRAIYM